MSNPIRVLIVEDRPEDAELMQYQLRQNGFDPDWTRVDRESDYLTALETNPDLILADWSLPHFSGLRALQLMKDRGLDIAFVIVSGTIEEQAALEAMRQGAVDYLMKDSLARLGMAARNALEIKQLRDLRKQEEARLTASEELHRTILETALDGFWLLDMQGRLLEVNEAYCRMSGYSAQELLLKHLTDLEFIEKVSETATHIQKVLTQGQDRFETRHRRKDGSFFDVEISVLYRSDRGGQMVAFLRDITERKQAEEQIYYQTKLLASVQDAIIGTDLHYDIQHWNAAAQNLYGWKADDVLGHPMEEFIQNEYLQGTLEDVVRQITEKGYWKGEVTQNRRDGTRIPILASVSAIKGKEGQTTGFVAVNRDITERKQAEQVLRESEVRFRELFNRMSSGVAVYEAIDNGGDFIIRDFNPAAEKIEKVSKKDILGRYVTSAFPGVKTFGIFEIFQRVWQTGKPEYFPQNIYRDEKDPGSWRESWVFKLPTGEIVAIYDNITERKLQEEKLKEYSEHLEEMVADRTRDLHEAQEQLVRKEKLAVMGQLAGSVGHELRNPLGVINTAIYYLKTVQPEAGGKIKRYHAMIEQEVHNADKIITDLLDFARGIIAERKPVAIPELLQRVIEHFPVPPAVEVKLEIPADLPMAFADPPQMEQVLGNLVVNAYQAMASQKSTGTMSARTGSATGVATSTATGVTSPAGTISTSSTNGGKLVISAKPSTVKGQSSVAIAVKDTGTGVSPENMQKIFEPLFTTKAKGIGLGLAVSRKLAEANGGWIEVESELGKGSTFTLYVPVN